MNECLSHLVGYMERQGRLYAPPSLMSPHASSKATLLRFGLICEDRRWIRFSHQSHLDYLIVEQILNQTLQRDQEPIDWLRKSPQTLVRRDQVRLLLQLLREEEPLIYSTFLGQIFAGEDIRFHLQHLALTTLGHAQIPSPDEIQLVKTLWSQEAWRRHVLELVLMGHRPWLECLTTDQTLPTLLDMQPDEERNQMLRLCKGSALAAPVWFEQILSPCWNSADPEWREIIARLLPYEADHETDAVFGWHLELARQGMNIDIHDMGFFFVDRLSKTHPGRAFAMLAAVVEGCIQHCRRMIGESGQRRIELDLSEYSHLEEACKRDCCSSWEQIIPAFRNAISFVDELVKGGHISRADVTKDSALNLVSFLHQLLVLSGAGRLRSEGMAFMDQLEAFLPPPASAPWSRLVVDILASAPADLADRAICFFLQMESPFDIKSESTQMEFRSKHCLSAQEPAKSLLQNLADHCSHDVFALLESAVLSFHPKRETKTIEWQLEEIREKCWLGTKPNHYGLAQYDLLLALPPDKLSDHGKTALRTWRYKFGDLQKHLNSSRLQIYTLVPVIPEQRARFISDSEWIKIVYGLQIKDRDSHRENDMTFSKASQDEFARTLQVAAASNPSRYICLGLHFPANSPGCYFESLLRAAAITVQPEDATAEWMPASTADVERLIHHIDDKMNREVARAITHLIDKRASESWSQSTLDLIKTLALNHPDPAQGSEFEATEECVDLQSLESVIFNSVRCTAISAVAQLLWHHPELLAWSKILAEEALCDSSPAVLAATLGLAFAIGKYELEWAACFMRRACAATPLPIVSTHYGQNLMQYVWSLETELAPVLKASLASDSKGAVKQAGFWVTIGSFKKGIYEELAVQAASGAPEARAGVVDALKVLINNSNSNCSKYLQRVSGFLDDHDAEVLEAVGRIMASDRFLDSPEAPAFAIQFAKSRAFLVDPSSLLYNLSGYEGSLLTFHEAIAASIAHFSDSVADAGGGLKGRQWYIELELSKLLLRLYSQAEDDLEVRSQCLDSWDMLLRTGSLNPGDLLSRIDAS